MSSLHSLPACLPHAPEPPVGRLDAAAPPGHPSLWGAAQHPGAHRQPGPLGVCRCSPDGPPEAVQRVLDTQPLQVILQDLTAEACAKQPATCRPAERLRGPRLVAWDDLQGRHKSPRLDQAQGRLAQTLHPMASAWRVSRPALLPAQLGAEPATDLSFVHQPKRLAGASKPDACSGKEFHRRHAAHGEVSFQPRLCTRSPGSGAAPPLDARVPTPAAPSPGSRWRSARRAPALRRGGRRPGAGGRAGARRPRSGVRRAGRRRAARGAPRTPPSRRQRRRQKRHRNHVRARKRKGRGQGRKNLGAEGAGRPRNRLPEAGRRPDKDTRPVRARWCSWRCREGEPRRPPRP